MKDVFGRSILVFQEEGSTGLNPRIGASGARHVQTSDDLFSETREVERKRNDVLVSARVGIVRSLDPSHVEGRNRGHGERLTLTLGQSEKKVGE